tara:strand:- start:515 stop:670 length:156 start_codon:yes stop_codon:yes gene_type:complete
MNELNFDELEVLIKLVANHFDNGEPTNNEWELSETLTTKLTNQIDSLSIEE